MLSTNEAVERTRLTPWDERALGVKTAEFRDLDQVDNAELPIAIEAIESWARNQGVAYLFGRIDSNNLSAKRALIDAGFVAIETSLTLSKSNLEVLPFFAPHMLPTFRDSTVADLPWLKTVAMEDFHHGRFLEDPFVEEVLSRQRTINWVTDLVEQGHLRVAEMRGRAIGFHAEQLRVCGNIADLILTGTESKYAMYALPMWTAALQSLLARGVGNCETLISSANVGVINLYARLNFKFERSLTGYRKVL